MNRLLNDFILAHEADSPAELMLHRERWPDIDMTEAVKCIQGRVKARSKLPLWYAEPGLVYPQSLSLEQCSSQATALYKQRFVNSGDRVADLTGGLGRWTISNAPRNSAIVLDTTSPFSAGIISKSAGKRQLRKC